MLTQFVPDGNTASLTARARAAFRRRLAAAHPTTELQRRLAEARAAK